jgi:gentisate 1,2-dioxygenase
MMLASGARDAPPLRSASCAFHVVKGSGQTTVNGKIVEWEAKDTFTAPVFADIEHAAHEESFLVRIHDRPLQEKLGYYEERDK